MLGFRGNISQITETLLSLVYSMEQVITEILRTNERIYTNAKIKYFGY